ncbi:UDP-2,4-diacetamido-2,4,6-trideoxy-beta-L-altropyranose hydrolase [Hymenobacter sp. YC55]|uniref:UDP-2,4-diacetamido-2,4, 6-trideoxy-beta-L-altropyranose hydrolase n=1 Tax=Hymenobacter sp. YC55 TaxID=3034019 RepID=UPI0023F77B17|nr:UDP-2,4-diacetamido-2,4,6-trideoxy-beta-L-altropyranose hydrolase [Hymenobacter sp. YC55]MDF7811132.1 UDP-2,4-diacetamido-2,4,6-trideoxy-beta-L-altropyranose hydrolase [Hymenobacter sp. YC55]
MRIIFRADGNAQIGLGHIVRSLALTSIVRQIAPCFFVVHSPTITVKKLLQEADVTLIKMPITLSAYSDAEADYIANTVVKANDIVVLDGYHFHFTYQKIIKSSGCSLVCIDDLHTAPFAADLIINHSPGVEESNYTALPTTRYCLGPAFSLLRTPFLEHAQLPTAVPVPITNALLCFGGADPQQFTTRVLTALLTIPTIQQVGVVLGGAFAHEETLFNMTAEQPPGRVNIHRNISAEEFATLFLGYQITVCPASTVLIESLVLGCAAITGYYVDNQRRLADYVHAHKQAFSLGDLTRLSDSELPVAIERGLHFHQAMLRLPYVRKMAHAQLQAEFEKLAQH